MQTLKLTKKYETYPEYKDSGVEWLGKTPKDWELSKARKFISQIEPGIWGDDPKQDNNDIKCLRVADFNFDKLTFNNVETVRNNPGIPSRKILKNGDILIEKSGGGEKQPVGRAVIFNSDEVMTCANFVDIIRLKKEILPRFFTYQLYAAYASKLNLKSIKQNTGIQNLDIFSYFSEMYLVPPHSQQTNIVKYLDEEIFRIDQITERKQKLIEILREKRTAVINHAVTKGLDLKVELVESGVDWIGKIPSNWEVKKLKSGFSFEKGKEAGKFTQEFVGNTKNIGEYPVYSGQTENDGVLGKINTYKYDYPKGVLFSTTVGAKAMTTKFLVGKFSLSQNCVLMIPNKKADSAYFNYLLEIGFKRMRDNIPSHMQPSLRVSDLNKFTVLFPPIESQEKIARYLNTKCEFFDTAINKAEAVTELLKEFKSSMISNVVTGKIKV